MWLHFVPALYAVFTFVLMIAAMEFGRRVALTHDAREEGELTKGTALVESLMFALLGLLVAFLFSSAASRAIDRRGLIITESNSIGTAYLRLDLLPASDQPGLRQAFRDYVDARLRGYDLMPDSSYEAEFERATVLQQQIWRDAVAASQRASNPVTLQLVLDPINDMIDITSTRSAAILTHPPTIVFVLLTALSLTCSLIAGRTMASRRYGKWPYRLGFAGMIAFALMVIVEIEFPRIGFLQIDRYDDFLRETRAGMN